MKIRKSISIFILFIFRLEKIACININEKILMQKSIKHFLSKYEREILFKENERFNDLEKKEFLLSNIFSDNFKGKKINFNYFVTNEGSIGISIALTKEIFEYLKIIEKEILKTIDENRFNYEEYRMPKVKKFIY